MNVTTTNAAIVFSILLSIPGESIRAEDDPRQGPFPNTISKEAKEFLIQINGDVVSNYILQDGQPVLEKRYREGEPSLRLTEDKIGGVKVFWVSSKQAISEQAVIVYFHGGGYTEGDGKSDGGFILPVLEAVGVKGLSVDYRLAPKDPFPAAVEDAVAVYRALLKTYKPSQIAFTGDSAGGGLALAAVLWLKEYGDPLPAAVGVISPGWMDAKRPGDTGLTLNDWDPVVTVESQNENIKKYAGKASLNNPRLSPIYGDFEGFPPLLIQVGTREMLLSDSVRLARKARDAGVDVTLDVWEGMWHSFHMQWPLGIPESKQASKFMADFLAKSLRIATPAKLHR